MKTVIIIGAGPAGLTAGYELLKKSSEYNVIILEEGNYIGGISRTINYKGNRMDIGGHRFFSKDQRVTKWWENFMPAQGLNSFDDEELGRRKTLVAGGPDPDKQEKVMLIRNRVSRIYYLDKFFDYPISMKYKTFKNMGLGQTVKAGFSYCKTIIHKREETSLENFYINRFGKVLYSMFFEKYTEKLWGRHPREISADWGAQRVKGLSISAVIRDMLGKITRKKQRSVETSLIEEFYYPKLGPGQLWEQVALEIGKLNGVIKMNSMVTKVNVSNQSIESVEYVCNGEINKLYGDIFVSTMPIKDLINSFSNKVPDEIESIGNGLPYRDFITVGLLVNKLAIKNETNIKTLGNIVPDCWIYVQDGKVKLGRIQIFNNWSPYMVNDPRNTVWIGLEYFCSEGDSFWNMGDEECIEYATNELVSIGIIKESSQVIDSHRERVKKAYPAYFDTYKDFYKVREYLSGFDNLYCIGRNGQHRYNNMDHSMVTAFEAVDNIVNGVKDKDNVWNVNTEKEYHEVKK